MSDLRLIVFDVDGTLVDSQAHIVGSMLSAYSLVGHTAPSRDDILSIIGLSLTEAVSHLSPDLSSADVTRVVEAYKAQFVAQRQDQGEAKVSPLYPGIRDMLDHVSAKPEHILGVATGKSRRGLDFVLDTHGLTGFFTTEQVADHHPSKPHPGMLHTALSETGTSPQKAVMIGDTSFDIEMGRAAGMTTIGVAWGYHAIERLTKAGADHIVHSVEALTACIEETGIALK